MLCLLWPAQIVAAAIEFDIGHEGMLAASQTEKSEFLVLKFERPITIATIAMGNQVIVDSLDDSAHSSVGRRSAGSAPISLRRKISG